MNDQVFQKYESEVRSYCRNFQAVFTTAKGAIMRDEDGKEYIDFFCGAGALNYGHNHPYVKEKVLAYLQNDGVMHTLDMYTSAKRDLIEYMETKLLQPRGLDYKIMFPAPTGTNAIEAALKLARKVKKRSNIMALMGCFHGMTMGALALTCDSHARGGAGVELGNVTHVPAPYMFPELDTLHYMDTILSDDHSGVDKPAALIVETVQAEGGIQVFTPEWLRGVRALCDKHDMLLIVDDIQIGCGRTGTFFSFERAGIVPDIVVLSKSVGGYGMPFALTLFKPELDQWTPGEHNGTFRGNQLAIVAAKAALELMLEQHLEAEVQRKSKIIEQFLKDEILPLDSRLAVRGIGFIWGVDFGAIDADIARKVMLNCFDNGLIVERAGRHDCVVKLMPPLIIDDDTLRRGLDILKESVKACL